MNTISASVVAVVLFCGVGITAITMSVEPRQGTWTGEISANHCGLTHPDGATARECTLECVGEGAAFVLVSDGKIYTFTDQTHRALRTHAGERVTVTGELRGNMLSPHSIARAVTEGSR